MTCRVKRAAWKASSDIGLSAICPKTARSLDKAFLFLLSFPPIMRCHNACRCFYSLPPSTSSPPRATSRNRPLLLRHSSWDIIESTVKSLRTLPESGNALVKAHVVMAISYPVIILSRLVFVYLLALSSISRFRFARSWSLCLCCNTSSLYFFACMYIVFTTPSPRKCAIHSPMLQSYLQRLMVSRELAFT